MDAVSLALLSAPATPVSSSSTDLRSTTTADAPLGERDIALVQSSFELVLPIADDAAALFYSRLFELDPSLRSMFRNDMKAQGRALMGMIRVAVAGLTKLDQIVPAVQALGRRHAGYGVKDEHYATVGSALLWTLEQGLGEAFTPETRTAWVKVYTLVAETMQQAAAEYRQAELVSA